MINRTLESVRDATTFVEVDSVAERGSIRTLTSVEVDSVVGTLYTILYVVSDNCARTFPEVCVGGTASVSSRKHVVGNATTFVEVDSVAERGSIHIFGKMNRLLIGYLIWCQIVVLEVGCHPEGMTRSFLSAIHKEWRVWRSLSPPS